MHQGCNVCCFPPRKIVRGINDISTTAPWMVKYIKNKNEIYTNSKYSKKVVDMVCSDCGRLHRKSIGTLYANKHLTCPCNDGWSYPNKFMYALLEQTGVVFKAEKSFEWSCGKIYDEYIEHNGLSIIVELHGRQHYDNPIHDNARTLAEEQANDAFKYELAISNGIDYYFVINASNSSLDYMQGEIINSKLLDILDIPNEKVDWVECHKFAISNFAKQICVFKHQHPFITLNNMAEIFGISYGTILRYIKIGNEVGWCNYQFDDAQMLIDNNLRRVNQKPIYCHTNGIYYRNANLASKDLSTDGDTLYPRQIRKSISRGQHYKGRTFSFVSQKEFNEIKQKTPDKAVGDYFILE